LKKYSFDKKFYKHLEGGDLDGGGIVIFKLIAPKQKNLYLHIYNSHNGYYSHGFEFKDDKEIIKKDYI